MSTPPARPGGPRRRGGALAEVLRSRYLRTVVMVQAVAAATGYLAGRYLPNTLAALMVIGSLAAAVTAPFITPIDPPPEEDT